MSSVSGQNPTPNISSGVQLVTDLNGQAYLVPSSVLASNQVPHDMLSEVTALANRETEVYNQKAVDYVMHYWGCYDETRYKKEQMGYAPPYAWSEASIADFKADGMINAQDFVAASQMK